VEELTIEMLEAEGFVKLGTSMAVAGSTRERDCMAANALWWRVLNSELGRDEVPFDRRSTQRADVAVAVYRCSRVGERPDSAVEPNMPLRLLAHSAQGSR
jgi:hypothetical protein